MVIVRPWPKAVRDPADESSDPPLFRCFYYMGLKKKPAPIYNSALRAANSVDLNGPVQEFRAQVTLPKIQLPTFRSFNPMCS